MIETQELPALDAPAVNGAVDAPAVLTEVRRLTREALLAAAEIKEYPTTIPGLGQVVLRQLAKGESNAIGKQVQIGKPDGTTEGDEDMAQRLILQACLVDPALSREDIDRLWAGRKAVADALMEEVYKLNELGKYAVTAESFRGES